MIRQYWFRLALVGGLAVGLGGCQSLRSTFGLDQPPPDEFVVAPQASLLMPPDFNLRPPQPGAPAAHAIVPSNEAETALLGQAAASNGAAASDPGVAAILNKTGAANANPAIRQTVDATSQRLADESRSFVSRLLFWKKPPPSGAVLNAEQEAQRLRGDEAMGEPVSAGQISIIPHQQRGWLEGIF